MASHTAYKIDLTTLVKVDGFLLSDVGSSFLIFAKVSITSAILVGN